jgi:hypothetical protein
MSMSHAGLCASVLVAAATLFMLTPGAAAQGALGVKAGVSTEPDQFYLGGQFESDPIADQLRFRPNLEIGIGDQRTLTAVNVEFVYAIPLRNNPWRVFLGAGPAFNIIHFGEDVPGHAAGGETRTEGGFNILVGLVHRDGLFAEFKVGALNSPDIKFGVGYSFGR